MYSVYILYSESAKRFYIGQTNNVKERIKRHNSGYEISTKPYSPWKLVCEIEKNNRSESIILEKKLKNLNTADLIKFIRKYSSSFEGREA
jgi:putative endonuclease